eukprot:gb/GECG01010927.1/.p1 GENE.gb/GECG01010927.1/~~gb/GECG01010927.1/.p1  ORF type:complete len:1297 (+),score=152.79 gb/GECG01010927.1/:1-3891(+)
MGRERCPPILVVAGTSSAVGKTTIACGLMAAFSQRNLTVQPYKVGPDFLDGKHHQAACKNARPSINLDGWMMGGKEQVLESFQRHAEGADICIIEGVMGLHDGRDGSTDEGSTAQIAKWLNAPVVLVVDAWSMARSVAAMVMGYLQLDPEMRLGAVIVNKVNGVRHIDWIGEALNSHKDRLRDSATGRPVLFAGAMPQDQQAHISERHLGLEAPEESTESIQWENLGKVMKNNIKLDELASVANTASPRFPTNPVPMQDSVSCRIAVAHDSAFHFYYHDNLTLLEHYGAKLVYFSPVNDPHLPPLIDALYIGGGYPELHAQKLQANGTMVKAIRSFVKEGGIIYAECGGLIYLARTLWAKNVSLSKDDSHRRNAYDMCSVFPELVVNMSAHAKMYYVEVEMMQNPVFDKGRICRGQKFHFSEIVNEPQHNEHSSPFRVTPQNPGAIAQWDGFTVHNVLASYYHLHFASQPCLAADFIRNVTEHSPVKMADSISFVSAATEIAFALGVENRLSGVTSICDYPARAQSYPRQIVCRSPFDASEMTSEEVATKMDEMRKESSQGPPGHWLVDKKLLNQLAPRRVFVQDSCDICDAAKSDVLTALQECGLLHACDIIRVSPATLEELFVTIHDIGEALDAADESYRFCNHLRQRLKRVREELDTSSTTGPRVLSLEGLCPPCVGGGWLPDVKEAAGCVDALGDKGGAPSRIITWEQVLKADPDVLLLSPCSASTKKTLNELHLLDTPEFWRLSSVQNGDVYIVDHDKFSRPGPRVVEGIEMLASLLRGTAIPEHIDTRSWSEQALKLKALNGKVEERSSELASRFYPCFSDSEERQAIESSYWLSIFGRNGYLPPDRCAHTMAATDEGTVIVHAGESSDGKLLSDVWRLVVPLEGWVTRGKDGKNQCEKSDNAAVWEWIQCSSVADENVPTCRSNSASAVCGDYFLVFGGWNSQNRPLDNCEILHLRTLCWTRCSTRGSNQPPPRGNPTLVYDPQQNAALLFGGWNGKCRLNDLWYLDMNNWTWIEKGIDSQLWPQPRTDHSAVIWTNAEGDKVMTVFGGSVHGVGPTADLWTWNLGKEEWKKFDTAGPAARTSHSAVALNDQMIIIGGTANGSGSTALLSDAWAIEMDSMSWRQLQWDGAAVQRCRHATVPLGSTKMFTWGGYNGRATVRENSALLVATVNDTQTGSRHKPDPQTKKKLQERWEAEVPVRESDLPDEMLEAAGRSTVPGSSFKALHRYAVSLKRDTYIDPATGYSVFTQHYHHKRGTCCGNGCRHCPYGHVNVPKSENGIRSKDPTLEW